MTYQAWADPKVCPRHPFSCACHAVKFPAFRRLLGCHRQCQRTLPAEISKASVFSANNRGPEPLGNVYLGRARQIAADFPRNQRFFLVFRTFWAAFQRPILFDPYRDPFPEKRRVTSWTILSFSKLFRHKTGAIVPIRQIF